MAKIHYGVKPDIFKKAAQKWPKFWVVEKFQHFGPPSSAKKVLLTAEKVGSAQHLPNNSGGVKHGHL